MGKGTRHAKPKAGVGLVFRVGVSSRGWWGVKLVSSGRMGLGEAFRFFSVGTGKPLEIWAKM